MRNLIVLLSSNREIHPATTDSVRKLRELGASYIAQLGSPDVALARNLALSAAAAAFQKHDALELVLMIDDDMLFEVAQAQEIAARVLETRHAASGVYATMGKTTACTRDPALISELFGNVAARGEWLAGLGFLCIHRRRVLELAESSEPFLWQGKPCWEFTKTHVLPGSKRWWSEDYWLSVRLGGVEVLPMGIGHLKTIPIYPDDATLDLIRRGAPLPTDDPSPITLTQR